MTVHDLIERLRALLSDADKADEPDSWPLSVSKADMRALLDAIELDQEHRHLIAVTSGLG